MAELTPQSPGALRIQSDGPFPIRLDAALVVAEAPRYQVVVAGLVDAAGVAVDAKTPLEIRDGQAALTVTTCDDPSIVVALSSSGKTGL